MQKSEKEEVIKELNEKFQRAQTAIVAEFSKLDVETVTKLRRKFREGKVEYKVIKNTLARRAAKGTSLEIISDDFTGPVALAISYEDVAAPAKILTEFIKDLETIKIRSAVVQGAQGRRRGREGSGEDAGSAGAACSAAGDADPAGGHAGPDAGGPRVAAGAGPPGQRRQGRVQVTDSRSISTTTHRPFLSIGSVGRLDELRRKNHNGCRPECAD